MKPTNFKKVFFHFTARWRYLLSIVFLAGSLHLSATHFTQLTYEENKIIISVESYNACFWYSGGYTDFEIYRNGVKLSTERIGITLTDRYPNLNNYEIDCSDLSPSSLVNIEVKPYHHDAFTFGYWDGTLSKNDRTLEDYFSVYNVQASDATSAGVKITWNINEIFDNHSYNVYRNNVEIASNLDRGTNSYTDTECTPGVISTYTVRGKVNTYLQPATRADNGTGFDLNYRASTTLDYVLLEWEDFSGTGSEAPDGYYIDVLNEESGSYEIVFEGTRTDIFSYSDRTDNNARIPGYPYAYRFMVTPLDKSDVIGFASGKKAANGVISGRISTPVSAAFPQGVGIPNTGVVATLIGDTLPFDSTKVYRGVTDENGEYRIKGVYYYKDADFNVVPLSQGSNFTLNFNGTDDYAEVNDTVIPASGDFTIEVWAKTNNISGYHEIISQNNSSTGIDFYLGRSPSGKIRMGDNWVETSVDFPDDNKWHHYTAVKTIDDTYLYVDGELKDSLNSAIENPVGSQFRIARQFGTESEYFAGAIDEIRVWDTARTETEIQNNMYNELVGDELGLVAYYNFNDASGDIITDNTNGGKDAVIENSPEWTVFAAPMSIAQPTEYSPDTAFVSLSLLTPNTTADFTNESSYLISGTIIQETGGSACPMPNVILLLDGIDQNVKTDSSGVFSIPVTQGGEYIVKPVLESHLFSPSKITVTVTNDVEDINFTDTTTYLVEGYLTASCMQFAGVAEIKFTDVVNECYSVSIITEDLTGYYSVTLPARDFKVELEDFTSFDENVVKGIDVLAHFAVPRILDLTLDTSFQHKDTVSLSFVYRDVIELKMEGISDYLTCSGDPVPVLAQHAKYDLELYAVEAFNGTTCSAESGYIVLTENVTSNGTYVNKDTIAYNFGDTVHIQFVPGTPNIISPYTKFVEAILFIGDQQRDTVRYDVIVEGHRPREKTFTTVAPDMPLYIIHNPPGDNSYSYLEEGNSLSTSFSTSFLQEGGVEAYLRAQLGPTVSVGEGVSMEIDVQLDITGKAGVGAGGLTQDASLITWTAKERFSTSDNENIIGESGDVYIGGAMNMIYAVSDVLTYNFQSCTPELSKTLIMQPDGFVTEFMYTENHVEKVIVPELEGIINYYNNKGSKDTADFYTNQLTLWQDIIIQNHNNIDSAQFVENKTFSAGLDYENSLESSKTTSHTFDFSWYIDYSVAVELGFSVAGLGAYGGVEVKGKSEWGSSEGTDATNTTTVGYVLSDDDIGDSYTVDVLNDSVYGVPAFRLVAGRTSCPWQQGTLPREGVQLTATSYSKSVEETQTAIFDLRLGNLSQSDEEKTYDLIFDHTSNPDAAVIKIGGSPIIGSVPYSYTIAPLQGTNATITINKGPVGSIYKDLKFTLKSQCDDNISQDIYLDVEFYKEYDLTLSTIGNGLVNLPVGVNKVKGNSTLNLFASPQAGFVFEKWIIDDVENYNKGIQIAVGGDITATAYFTPTILDQYNLNIYSFGKGITMPPAGSYLYVSGAPALINAVPDENNIFVKWIINGIEVSNPSANVTITDHMTAVAYFKDTTVSQYSLDIDISGNGISVPASGMHNVDSGGSVNLTAIPNAGNSFIKWVIDGTEVFDSITPVTFHDNMTAVAYFVESLGISEYKFQSVTIYPNPSSGLTEFKSDENISAIHIYNILGNLVFENHDLNTTYFKENLSHLKSGIYLVVVHSISKVSKTELYIYK